MSHKVCKKAFAAIHGISAKRVDRLAAYLKNRDNITSPRENRGKHNTRPNMIPPEIVEQVDSHIRSFPKRSSHYSRQKNKNKMYL